MPLNRSRWHGIQQIFAYCHHCWSKELNWEYFSREKNIFHFMNAIATKTIITINWFGVWTFESSENCRWTWTAGFSIINNELNYFKTQIYLTEHIQLLPGSFGQFRESGQFGGLDRFGQFEIKRKIATHWIFNWICDFDVEVAISENNNQTTLSLAWKIE